MVGTQFVFTEDDLLSQVYGEFASKAKSSIIQFMTNQGVGLKRISAFLDQLSTYIKPQINSFWEEYGLTQTKFYVTDVSVDTSTPEGQKVSAALASQASMSITGHSWQQEQMFGTVNNAVEQMGNASGGNGMLAGLMAVNMMGGGMGAGVGAGMMQTHPSAAVAQSSGMGMQPTQGGMGMQGGGMGMQGGGMGMQGGGVREVYCANCSKKHLSTERFCPHCGNEYRPCPTCGSDNPPSARRCVSCGTPLQQGQSAQCSSCHAPLTPGAAFCPNCGAPQQSRGGGNQCPRCGCEAPMGTKFCPKCGQKMG